MKEINKDNVLKAIETQKIKNKLTSDKIAKIAIKDILKEDKQLKDLLNLKDSKISKAENNE